MITADTLITAVGQKLHETFEDHAIYTEEIPTGFVRPSFFIYLVPLDSLQATNSQMDKGALIKIDYYSANETKKENRIMIDQLEDTFGRTLKLPNTTLTVDRTNSQEVEKVLSFTIQVEYRKGVNSLLVGDKEILPDERLDYVEGKVKLMNELEMEG